MSQINAHTARSDGALSVLAQVDRSARSFHDASDHTLERFKRHHLVSRIERRLIEEMTELSAVFEMRMSAELISHISVKTDVMEEIVALEDAVVFDHPEIGVRNERLEDRRRCHHGGLAFAPRRWLRQILGVWLTLLQQMQVVVLLAGILAKAIQD